ncbi:L-asparagine permease [Leifsonia xyli subsp. cynodontis DSM 46306]|jgi:L-asparagine permease|uniref:Amino acid permease/ SLC12A domain-containing protein n=1 Tax=Leifsonia xyli subsp. cynodontis DSM 46306 TaxID=1389489 RepID=U3PCF4_LEIXC|nr:amino acid permease [Leifsonia xyli]AGW42427.1 L-asparagine permease [Leifsonia xyli subsp. cynodontis DSM 46306]
MTTSHDPADELENRLEHLGDVSQAVQSFASEQEGYRKSLSARQVQMIAIGGAIGTGLFLGAGGRLQQSGPLLVFVYAVCGFFAFLVLRALGELVLHRPSSGSFVSYAREFFGEKMAYVAGWMYFLNWAMTAIVDSTAIALYVKYWSLFSSVPQWLLALIALVIVVSLNLISVKVFGEMEFWFALIKVGALVTFLVVGIVVLAAGWPTDLGPTGIPMLAENGWLLPNGVATIAMAIVLVQGVVFAYAAVELVGIAAGETEHPEKIMPRAINSVVFRIVVFYCGSVLLLALLLPASAYSGSESPFVTFFSHLGGPQLSAVVGSIMNFVVLTAALSSLNAGMYSTGRILHSMAQTGAAPRFTSRMSKQGVPYGGILLTAVIGVFGVFLNLVVPAQAFNIVLNVAALGIITSWAMIVLCQMQLRRWSLRGTMKRPAFRLIGAPFTAYLTLAFLLAVLVLMTFDYPTGTWTIASLVVIAPLLAIGWFAQRGRILAIAAKREGYTGAYPVIAARPLRREHE